MGVHPVSAAKDRLYLCVTKCRPFEDFSTPVKPDTGRAEYQHAPSVHSVSDADGLDSLAQAGLISDNAVPLSESIRNACTLVRHVLLTGRRGYADLVIASTALAVVLHEPAEASGRAARRERGWKYV